ncbi:MAG TPA: vWA domain-containing protein [Polyangiaceae bacterium]|jgi:Mg-chelatase subunit ChlD
MRKLLPLAVLALVACNAQKEAPQSARAGGAFDDPAAAKEETAASADGLEERGAGGAPKVGHAHGAARAPAGMEPMPLAAATTAAPSMQATASVRAGEWDDNANYREFQRYIGQVNQPIHSVDVRARRFLVVRDNAGKPVSRCPVTIADASQHDVTLTTHASGRAILFPYAEGLSGKSFTATARCAEGNASAPVALDDDGDGTVEIKLGAARRNDPRVVDIAFVLDTTGSMSEEIASVKATIQKVATTLQSNQLQVRVGMVEYKDRVDSFVTKPYAFTSNLGAFSHTIAGIEAGGGGDYPEDMNAGIHAALTSLEWSPRAVAKMAFVIADAPPHLDYANDPDYAQSMKDAAHSGVQLFGVAASGMDALGQAVLRQMAQYTGATEMFVLRGGAGPQSTGGGDPIASCGGTQQQYASGNLDGLIVAKIKHELAAIDADPMKIPGLRVDENAKPCAERFD